MAMGESAWDSPSYETSETWRLPGTENKGYELDELRPLARYGTGCNA